MSTSNAPPPDRPGRIPGTVVLALSIGATVGSIGAQLLPIVLGALRSEFDLSQETVGAVSSLHLLTMALTVLAATGWAAGPRRGALAVTGVVVAIAGLAASALAPDLLVLFISQALTGAGTGLTYAAVAAAVAATADVDRAAGLMQLGSGMLVAVLIAVLPIVFDIGYAAGFWFLAGIFALTVPVFLRLPRAPAQRDSTGRLSEAPHRAAAMLVIVATFLFFVSEVGFYAFAEEIARSTVGLDATAFGASLAFATLVSLGALAVVTALGRRIRRSTLTIVALAGGALFKWAMVQITGVVGFVVFQVLWGTTTIITLMVLTALAAALDVLGRWAAVSAAAGALGSAAGPWAAGIVTQAAGYQTLATVVLGTGLLAAIVLVPMARRFDVPPPAVLAPAPPSHRGRRR